MRYIQFYKLSTGYIEGTIPPQYSKDHIKPIEALGSSGVKVVDGRIKLAKVEELARKMCVTLGFVGFRVYSGASFSSAKPLTDYENVNLPHARKMVFSKARDLLADPSKWTQKEYARDKEGNAVSPYSEEATCFCSIGAVIRSAFDLEKQGKLGKGFTDIFNMGAGRDAMFDPLADAMKKKEDFFSIAYFNDNHTHEEVLQAFDNAIKECDK